MSDTRTKCSPLSSPSSNQSASTPKSSTTKQRSSTAPFRAIGDRSASVVRPRGLLADDEGHHVPGANRLVRPWVVVHDLPHRHVAVFHAHDNIRRARAFDDRDRGLQAVAYE